MSEFFEAGMMVLFGLSWPTSILKSWKSGTSKGKSVVFMLLVMVGYVSGIISKLVSGHITYVFVFYVINLLMVGVDCTLYFRNAKRDRQAEASGNR